MSWKNFDFSTACTKTVLSFGVYVAFAAYSASASSGEAKMHTIVTVKADSSLEYSGFCKSDQLPNEIQLSGKGERSLSVKGTQVQCEIEILAGATTLVLEMVGTAGNRARTSTRGVGSKVRLKTG